MNDVSKIGNYLGLFPVNPQTASKPVKEQTQSAKNMQGYISKVQLARITQDILTWRDAVKEAENAWWPHRVKMQQLYLDTTLNGHVFACMEARRDITLLRKYHICNQKGETNEAATELINNQAFGLVLKYAYDAIWYGYSLINWSAVVANRLTGVKVLRRANVSPDREVLTAFIYSLDGIKINDPVAKDELGNKIFDWTLWVTTPSEDGISNCGYGLLYRVALYEIFIRNNMGYNADFVEKFVMPLIVGKTSKTEEHERAELEEGLKNLASAAVAVIDPTDEIELHESKNTSAGFKAYGDFEVRCESKISKIVLGHSHAIDSESGKLGNNEDIKEAIENKAANDAVFMEAVINDQLLPKLRNLGFNIPITDVFRFKNDTEVQEARVKEDEANKITAETVKTLKDAGLEVDELWFTERTNIPVKRVVEPEPVTGLAAKVKNKLDELYD